MTNEFPKNTALKYLRVMKNVDIGLLRPSTIPILIAEVADIDLLRPVTLPLVIAEDIMVVMLVELVQSHKIPYKIPFAIREK